MKSVNLLILGAGQYGNVVKENALAMGCYNKICFLDDKKKRSGVIGTFADYLKFKDEYPYAFVAIGNADVRVDMYAKLEEAGYIIPVIVNAHAYISPSAQLGKGTIIEACAVVNSKAVVGRGCIVCAGAVVSHNAVVGDCCEIDSNAVIENGAKVPPKTKVPSGTVYKQ